MKTICGRTEYFEVKVGLHQGSALSPLLFIVIMDVLAEEARTKPPWAMPFADELVLVSETVEEVEEELERRRGHQITSFSQLIDQDTLQKQLF